MDGIMMNLADVFAVVICTTFLGMLVIASISTARLLFGF
jgi:hypothetical protein